MTLDILQCFTGTCVFQSGDSDLVESLMISLVEIQIVISFSERMGFLFIKFKNYNLWTALAELSRSSDLEKTCEVKLLVFYQDYI